MQRAILLHSIRVTYLVLSFSMFSHTMIMLDVWATTLGFSEDTTGSAIGLRSMNLADRLALSTITQLPADLTKQRAMTCIEAMSSAIISNLVV